MVRDSIETVIERIQTLIQRSTPALSDLDPYLNHPSAEVRAAAYAALWNIPGKEVLSLLLERAERGGETVEQVAIHAALGRFIWMGPQIDEGLAASFGYREPVGREEIGLAQARLQSTLDRRGLEDAVARAALYSLSFDADDGVHAAIERLWTSPKLEDRLFALQCMGRTGDRRWRGQIVNSLSAAERAMVLAAMEAAAEGCVEAAEPRLIEWMQGSDRELQLAAIWAMRNVVHTTPGRKALDKLARGRDMELKKQARLTLAEVDAIDIEERPDNDDD